MDFFAEEENAFGNVVAGALPAVLALLDVSLLLSSDDDDEEERGVVSRSVRTKYFLSIVWPTDYHHVPLLTLIRCLQSREGFLKNLAGVSI